MRLLAEAGRVARSQPVSSTITLIIVGAVVGVILATTGQTVQAENAVLSRIDEAGTRSIVVSDTEGRAGLDPGVVDRIGGLSGVEWVVGLGPAADVRAVGLPGGEAVAVRVLYGTLPPPITASEWDRAPGTALAGPDAQNSLGLRVPAGGLEGADGTALAVVGGFQAAEPLDFLNRSLLTAPNPAAPDPVLRSIHLLAHRPDQVAALADAVAEVLGPADPTSVAIQTSATLADIRAAVQGELGTYNRRLVLLVLGVGLTLAALNTYAAVSTRRRELGRRRALGANRGTIIGLITLQTALTGLAGAALGAAVGAGVVWRLTDQTPGLSFTAAVALLALLAATVAALPPAIHAARRDPVTALRIP